MYDYQLIELITPIIENGLIAWGFGEIPLVASPQPTMQGVSTENTVYITKIGDHHYGHPKRENTWDPEEEKMMATFTQNVETTFQINALVIQNVATPHQFTASDVVNAVANIIYDTATLEALAAQNVGIYRPQEMRNPYFTDDRDREEASPNFDFTLTHKLVNVSEIPPAESINPGIYGV